jgi:hypothetical protein
MALPQGINFRQNSSFVTDGTGENVELQQGANDYPRTTPQGNTVGWESGGLSINTRDRNASLDRRLAGLHFNISASSDFRIDLPSSGSYNIRLAAGDNDGPQEVNVTLYDGTTSLGVLSSGTTGGAAHFKDATNTDYTAAAWPGSNTAVTKSFSTTIARFRLNPSSSGSPNVISHVYVESAGGGGGTTFQFSGSVNATGTLVLTRKVSKANVASATGTVSVAKKTSKAFIQTATGAASVVKKTSKAFTSAASGTASVAKKISKALASSAAATVAMSTASVLGKSFSAAATGAVTLATKSVLGVTSSVTAVGAVSLSKKIGKSFATAATGAASRVSKVSKAFTVAASGTPQLARKISKAFTRAASGAVSFTEALVLPTLRTIAAHATVTATQLFIEGNGLPTFTMVRDMLRAVTRVVVRQVNRLKLL